MLRHVGRRVVALLPGRGRLLPVKPLQLPLQLSSATGHVGVPSQPTHPSIALPPPVENATPVSGLVGILGAGAAAWASWALQGADAHCESDEEDEEEDASDSIEQAQVQVEETEQAYLDKWVSCGTPD